MSQYDLIVIGSGPAGQRAAIQGAKSGKKVALIERREVIGGVCINTGTIPSKTMREAVLHLSGYNYQNIYGVSYRVKEKITMADLAFRVQHVIKTEVDVTTAQLSRNGIEVLTGVASFKGPNTVLVTSVRGSNEITGDNIVIGTGTKPAHRQRSRSMGRRSSTVIRCSKCRTCRALSSWSVVVLLALIHLHVCRPRRARHVD